MSVQQKTFVVDGDTYTCTQLGAKKGRRLWLKLMQALAPTIKELSTRAGGGLKVETILAAFAAGIGGLDEETTEALYEAYGETCTLHVGPNNTPLLNGVVFDQHFAGKYISMSKWLWECTSFNFTGFLDDTAPGSMGVVLRNLVERKQASLKGSTGSSGES